MPRLSTASPFSTMGFYPPLPGPPPVIPVGALVFYNSAFTSLPGWTRYATADGHYLKGTATQVEIETTTTASLSGNLNVTINSAGAHFPTQISFGPAYNPSGTAFPGGWFNVGTAGAHTHTAATLNLSTIAVPGVANFQTYIIIQCTSETTRLPANCVVFSQNQPASSFTQITPNNLPIRGGLFNGTTASTPISNTRATATSGTHSHIDTNYAYDPATVTSTNYPYVTTTTHSHNLSLNIAAASVLTKLLSAWGSTAETYLNLNSILMYSGSLTSLPAGWYVCDGNNGTVNMVNYFVGIGSQLAYNTTTGAANNITATGTTTNNTWNHSHRGSGVPGATPATLASVPHAAFSASHSHTVTPSFSGVSYDPGTIKIAFIQYKG